MALYSKKECCKSECKCSSSTGCHKDTCAAFLTNLSNSKVNIYDHIPAFWQEWNSGLKGLVRVCVGPPINEEGADEWDNTCEGDVADADFTKGIVKIRNSNNIIYNIPQQCVLAYIRFPV